MATFGVATPASDIVLALCAWRLTARIAGPDGSKAIQSMTSSTGCCSILAIAEVVTEVTVPAPRSATGAAFEKLVDTKACIAKVNAAVLVERDGDVCRKARIALGAVASMVVRARAAENLLQGGRMNPELIADAAALAVAAAAPVSDSSTAEYRRNMVRVLTGGPSQRRGGGGRRPGPRPDPDRDDDSGEPSAGARKSAAHECWLATFIVNGRNSTRSRSLST